MDLVSLIKEFNLLGAVITGLIMGAFQLIGQNTWAKKIRNETKLINKAYANKIDSDIMQINHKIDATFGQLISRVEVLEKQQASLSSTLHQWLGNVENLVHLVLEHLPAIKDKNNAHGNRRQRGGIKHRNKQYKKS